MSTLSQKSSLAEWVTANPGRSRVLEELGIDYCCGGKIPLGEVCAEKGLEVGEVIGKLQRVEEDLRSAEQVNWAEKELEDLIEHIEGVHHLYLRKELPRLSNLAGKAREAHGGNHPELLEIEEVYNALRNELEPHMKKEEMILFPLIRRLQTAHAEGQSYPQGIQNPIRAMETEHETAGRSLERLRKLSHNYTPPNDACNTYRALMEGLEQLELDLHQHIHEENNILFPRVLQAGVGIEAR